MAPGPEGGHHIGDDDIECLIIAGIHEEVCVYVCVEQHSERPQEAYVSHTPILNATMTSRTDRGKAARNPLLLFGNNKHTHRLTIL